MSSQYQVSENWNQDGTRIKMKGSVVSCFIKDDLVVEGVVYLQTRRPFESISLIDLFMRILNY